MAYHIQIHEEKILFIGFYGYTGAEENEKARSEILQICRDSGIKFVLSDWREAKIDPNISTMDLHQFGCTWDTFARLRIATVLPTDTTDIANIKFSETVAHNRGLISRTFNDHKEAINWLIANR